MGSAIDRLFQRGSERPISETAPSPIVEANPDTGGTLRELAIDALSDFPNHPFRAYSTERMEALRESIIRHGIIVRLLVRPKAGGGYQIISGHNRRTAARLAGYVTVPCEVRKLSDDAALVQMIEANLQQREGLLPSEKAWAYRLRLEAMNRQGQRTDLTLRQLGAKSRSDVELSSEVTDSARQIQRYIRLTYLIPTLLELVDAQKLGLTVGAELSYLSQENQGIVYTFCCVTQIHPITQQIVDSLRARGEKPLTEEALQALFSPVVSVKPPRNVPVPMKPLRRFFPPETPQKEIQKVILAALTAYFDGKPTQ